MPAGNITASTRYFQPNITVVYYCPAIAIKTAPTRAELNAGTNLTNEISGNDGWAPETDFIDAPDLANRFVAQVAGRIKAPGSSLTFYASSNSVDVRGLLPRDTTGFIVWLDEGDIAGRKMDVFPITVASAPKQRDIEAVKQIQIQFSISSAPAENVTVPA
jgi:hypothetical protein